MKIWVYHQHAHHYSGFWLPWNFSPNLESYSDPKNWVAGLVQRFEHLLGQWNSILDLTTQPRMQSSPTMMPWYFQFRETVQTSICNRHPRWGVQILPSHFLFKMTIAWKCRSHFHNLWNRFKINNFQPLTWKFSLHQSSSPRSVKDGLSNAWKQLRKPNWNIKKTKRLTYGGRFQRFIW